MVGNCLQACPTFQVFSARWDSLVSKYLLSQGSEIPAICSGVKPSSALLQCPNMNRDTRTEIKTKKLKGKIKLIPKQHSFGVLLFEQLWPSQRWTPQQCGAQSHSKAKTLPTTHVQTKFYQLSRNELWMGHDHEEVHEAHHRPDNKDLSLKMWTPSY